ncbi:MAG: mevalonate kinase [Anaerolineales bacterium]|nr:mevalonate kinase [Anaerolineales bacterium]
MPALSASAPGKVILFGEHAVVYGQPAIAVPVTHVQAKAIVTANPRGTAGSVHIQAPDIDLDCYLRDLAPENPLAKAINGVLTSLSIEHPPAFNLRVTSSIPLASGMGSGAAISVAVIRVVAAFLGRQLPDEQVSALTYEVEKIYHGTPSGIDNTVVTYAMPVYFIKGQPIQTFAVNRPFTIVIGNTGVRSPTSVAVGDVRKNWQADPASFEALFAQIGEIAQQARLAIEAGQIEALGPLMDENHKLLQALTVSSPELDQLVDAARQAGALGAKLSGGGRGGNMIALADAANAQAIVQALIDAGATGTITTAVGS